MEQPIRPLGLTLMTVLMLMSVAACSLGGGGSRQGFPMLDQAVADVNPGLLGQIAYDGKQGTAKPLSQGPTRYILVIVSGDRDTALRAVRDRLSAARFRPINSLAWRRVEEKLTVLVYAELFNSGQKPPKGHSVPAGHTGVWFNFNTGT